MLGDIEGREGGKGGGGGEEGGEKGCDGRRAGWGCVKCAPSKSKLEINGMGKHTYVHVPLVLLLTRLRFLC